MKFFTPQVCDSIGFHNIETLQTVRKQYREHLNQIRSLLSEPVVQLSTLSGLEDALVARVIHDRPMSQLRLVLRCGNLQVGYFNLNLSYKSAFMSPEHDLILAEIARSTRTQTRFGCDLAFHEIDLTPEGQIIHRLMFNALEYDHPNSGGWLWFAIQSREIKWRTESKRSRRLPPLHDRYLGGPTS